MGLGFRSVMLAGVLAAAAAGCDRVPLPASTPLERGAEKPSAPVLVTTSAHEVAAGVWQVELVARPLVDADALELRLGDRRELTGPTRAGQARRLRTHVTVAPGDGVDVVGSAAVAAGGARRSRAGIARAGAPAPIAAPVPTRTITLPDGRRVAEVR